jgi:hypothetical protein
MLYRCRGERGSVPMQHRLSHHRAGDTLPTGATMHCALWQHGPHRFSAALILHRTPHTTSIAETIVCHTELTAPFSQVFGAIDEWLRTGHRLRAPRCSWQPAHPGDDSAPSPQTALIARLTPHDWQPPGPRPAACTCVHTWVLFGRTAVAARRPARCLAAAAELRRL